MTIDQAMQIALEHHQAGRLAEAEPLYRQVLSHDPDHPDALHLLGVLAGQCGRADMAIDLIGRAVQIDPNLARAHSDLGTFLRQVGRRDEAAVCWQRAIQLMPDYTPAHNNLGNLLRDLGRLDEAIASYQRAVAIDPQYADAHYNLGIVLAQQVRLAEAIAEFRAAIRLTPDAAAMHNNLGAALLADGQYEAALASAERAIQIQPDLADAHWNIAWLSLLLGDFARGWREYEWRLRIPGITPPRDFTQPRWTGEDLSGRTIHIHAEQGVGDTIQFLRYIPLVAVRGGRVIVEVQPSLLRLCTGLAGADQIIAEGQPLPPGMIDFQCPLISLPLIFKTDLTAIPATVPYLWPQANLMESWRERLAARSTSNLKVGLVWSGSDMNPVNARRSMKLAQMADLAAVAGVDFFSLQVGPSRGQITDVSCLRPFDHTSEFHDYADTAALLTQLDLLITVDTSVAHLAGAMGKRTWLMLAHGISDWRWLLNREDNPWYPSMRLFRQPTAGDWDSVIRSVHNALQALLIAKP
jgi:tetratricopeptide (TPR) repeat protein